MSLRIVFATVSTLSIERTTYGILRASFSTLVTLQCNNANRDQEGNRLRVVYDALCASCTNARTPSPPAVHSYNGPTTHLSMVALSTSGGARSILVTTTMIGRPSAAAIPVCSFVMRARPCN